MGAILNGMTYISDYCFTELTFLIFSEYMRAPIRLAAIMGIRPIYIFIHDSIALGRRNYASAGGTVNFSPFNSKFNNNKTFGCKRNFQAWRVALEHKTGPVALILTRQKLPVIDRNKFAKKLKILKGSIHTE